MYQTDDNLSVAFADGQNEIRKSQAAERMRERVERIRANKAMGAEAVPSPTMPEQTEQTGGSWADKAGAVAKDIAMGATVEAPRALAHGALNAVNEGLQSIYQLGDWLRGQGVGPDGYLEFFGESGPVAWKSGNVPADKVPQLPNMDAPKSTTGELLSGLSQWTAGMMLTGKAAPLAALSKAGKAGAVASAMGRGAVTDFAFMDEAAPALSDLVQKYPSLRTPLSEFLSSSPDDSAVEKRLKHSLEGLGLGAVSEGVIHGLKAMRGLKSGKSASGAEEQIENAVRDFVTQKEATRAQYRAFSEKMGNPDGPLFSEPDKLTRAADDVAEAMG